MILLDFMHVGYGDAILVRDTAAKYSLLIDCGDEAPCDASHGSRICAADFLKQQGIKTLDLLVLTHLHRDHCGDLLQILRTVHVKTLWTTFLPPEETWGKALPVPENLPVAARSLLSAINLYTAALPVLAQQHTHICLPDEFRGRHVLTGAVTAEAFPAASDILKKQQELWTKALAGQADLSCLLDLDSLLNNTSTRLRLTWGNECAELPGDLSASVLEAQHPEACTILKLPHHGHRDSMTPTLLEMLRPKQVIISVDLAPGDVCPSEEIMDAIRQCGCQLEITGACSKSLEDSPCDAIHLEFSDDFTAH